MEISFYRLQQIFSSKCYVDMFCATRNLFFNQHNEMMLLTLLANWLDKMNQQISNTDFSLWRLFFLLSVSLVKTIWLAVSKALLNSHFWCGFQVRVAVLCSVNLYSKRQRARYWGRHANMLMTTLICWCFAGTTFTRLFLWISWINTRMLQPSWKPTLIFSMTAADLWACELKHYFTL